jgi:hypothetical protein
MLTKLNSFIINCSQSWWKFLLLLAGQAGTMQVLNGVTREFPAATNGDIPFDMQNSLKPDEIFTQLAGYTDEAFDLYMLFQAVDFFFPLFAGLMLATVCTFALRNVSDKFYALAAAKNLFVLLLIPTLFDWLENINLLWAVLAWPEQINAAANLAVMAKLGKLSTMGVSFLLTGGLLITAAVMWLGRKAGIINKT